MFCGELISPVFDSHLCQSETTGGGFDAGQFVPERLRHVLGHQGVGGLDLRKRLAHGGGAGEVEGDGEEKAALKKEQLEQCNSKTYSTGILNVWILVYYSNVFFQ